MTGETELSRGEAKSLLMQAYLDMDKYGNEKILPENKSRRTELHNKHKAAEQMANMIEDLYPDLYAEIKNDLLDY